MGAVAIVFLAVRAFRCFVCPSPITLSTGNAPVCPCERLLIFEILFELHRRILNSLRYKNRMSVYWEKQGKKRILRESMLSRYCFWAKWVQVFILSIKTCRGCGLWWGRCDWLGAGGKVKEKNGNSRVISRWKAADCLHSVPHLLS